jgi:Protein of unknown function (DUF3300)
MGRSAFQSCVVAVLLGTTALQASAQQADTAAPAATQSEETAALTAAELQKLVAPIALYPDTVLIQILIAATAPLDVVKADRLLSDNADTPKATLDQKIKDAQFDPSVEVLALGFPTLIRQMAVHIDWTEAIGIAMLAQSEDVLDAVQIMRMQAVNSGALVSSPEMVVTQDPVTSTVVVQPANPQVVYIPQYEPAVVYANPVGNAVTAGLIFFGTVALIDEIFDDDDHWNDYWGCRNCGGWGNGAIIRNPDIDIDINGDVNIDRDVARIWKPDNDQVLIARNQIAVKRSPDGTTRLGLERPASRSDELRAALGPESIRDGRVSGATAGQTLGADPRNVDRPAASNLTDRTPNAKPVQAAKTKARPTAKPKASATTARAARPKVAKTSSATKTRAASTRGRSSTVRARR